MSQTHIKAHKTAPPIKRKPVVEVLLAVVVIVAILTIELLIFRPRFINESDDAAAGTILETRIATVGNFEGGRGGYILYQLEAHVRYGFGREMRDRWLPASGTSSNRADLLLVLAGGPKQCLVHWQPGHEDHARCEVQTASK